MVEDCAMCSGSLEAFKGVFKVGQATIVVWAVKDRTSWMMGLPWCRRGKVKVVTLGGDGGDLWDDVRLAGGTKGRNE